MKSIRRFSLIWLMAIVIGTQYANGSAEENNDMRREVDGYGGGDSIEQAIEVAKLDAVVNAAGSKILSVQTDNVNENNQDRTWSRSNGMLWSYVITEKGDDFAGAYARVKANVTTMPMTRPLEEAMELKFSVDDNAISKIKNNAVRGLSSGVNEVAVEVMGKDSNEALTQALKIAVERVAGRFYEVSEKMSGEEIERSQSLSIANGYVESYTIEKEETDEKTGTVRIHLKAKVRCGGVAKTPFDALSPIQRKTLTVRNEEICNLLMVELDNMKSLIPYLYDIVLVSQNTDSDKTEIGYEIRINETVYYKVFLPRFLQILTVISEENPLEINNIVKYDTANNSVKVTKPGRNTNLDVFGITVVDQADGVSSSHALNYTLNPQIRRMIKEWRRQEFKEAKINFRIVSRDKDGKLLYGSDTIAVKAKKLHNTPVPYFARGWGFWFDDIWLPVISDKNAVIRGKIKADLSPAIMSGQLSIEKSNVKPILNMAAIKSARYGSDDPTFGEKLLNIIVRIGLVLILLLCLILVIFCFVRHWLLGLISLCTFGWIGIKVVILLLN